MRNHSITVNVNIPALSELVALLRENQQAEIDAMAATIGLAIDGLKTSTTALQGAIKQSKEK